MRLDRGHDELCAAIEDDHFGARRALAVAAGRYCVAIVCSRMRELTGDVDKQPVIWCEVRQIPKVDRRLDRHVKRVDRLPEVRRRVGEAVTPAPGTELASSGRYAMARWWRGTPPVT
jgi:hypothetical protein